jgi:hypothetical protein
LGHPPYAFAGTIRTQRYSAPIAFTPTKENNRLLLILDKTSEEFQKASDAMEVALLPGK